MKNEVKEFLKWAVNSPQYCGLLKMLAIDEGVVTTSYIDTRGNTTIGVGRNLSSNPLSFDEIALLLLNDMNNYAYLIGTCDFGKNLSHHKISVLINMAFNLGWTRFLGFKKMIKALEAQDYKLAAAEIRDSKYWRDKDTHNRAERIAKMIETDKMDPYYEL